MFGDQVCNCPAQLLQFLVTLQAYAPIVSQLELDMGNISLFAIESKHGNFLYIQNRLLVASIEQDFIPLNLDPVIPDQAKVAAVAIVVDEVANDYEGDDRPQQHVIIGLRIQHISGTDDGNQCQAEQRAPYDVFLADLQRCLADSKFHKIYLVNYLTGRQPETWKQVHRIFLIDFQKIKHGLEKYYISGQALTGITDIRLKLPKTQS